MRGDARLPVGSSRPHNPKVAGSNPAPATKQELVSLAKTRSGLSAAQGWLEGRPITVFSDWRLACTNGERLQARQLVTVGRTLL